MVQKITIAVLVAVGIFLVIALDRANKDRDTLKGEITRLTLKEKVKDAEKVSKETKKTFEQHFADYLEFKRRNPELFKR